MEEILFDYQKKFKLLIMLTLLDLNTADKRKNFVKGFKLNLFNKTQPELRQMVIKQLNELAKTYKHLNISGM